MTALIVELMPPMHIDAGMNIRIRIRIRLSDSPVAARWQSIWVRMYLTNVRKKTEVLYVTGYRFVLKLS